MLFIFDEINEKNKNKIKFNYFIRMYFTKDYEELKYFKKKEEIVSFLGYYLGF